MKTELDRARETYARAMALAKLSRDEEVAEIERLNSEYVDQLIELSPKPKKKPALKLV